MSTATGSGTILDLDQHGALYLFFAAADHGHTLVLSQADTGLRGDFEFDGLGMLAGTPGVDLDRDGIDDLVIGAPGANVITTEVIPAAGKVFAVYGASVHANLPANAQEIGNRSLTGSGFFMVDNGTGRPEAFMDAPTTPSAQRKFTLLAGESERWYRFTTLGDGMPGNAIRITPGSFDGFVAPVDPDTSAVTVNKPVEEGNALTAQPYVDASLVGSLWMGDQFANAGRLTGWSVFSGVFTGTRSVTPVIFKQTADAKYQITGIGATRAITSNDVLSFAFDLQSGSDAVGPGYYIGWKDGSAVADNPGSISYSNGGDTMVWFGPNQGAAGNVVVGRTLTPVFSSLAKTYAIRTSVSVGQVLEFDLGRFLGWAGNPDAVGSATLILDAPTAAGPVQAPTSVSSLTFSGNRLFFTAFDDHGFELWVTDGTKAGTRLVADLNPGVLGSYPANLVDVGGVLYFTANSGAGGCPPVFARAAISATGHIP